MCSAYTVLYVIPTIRFVKLKKKKKVLKKTQYLFREDSRKIRTLQDQMNTII